MKHGRNTETPGHQVPGARPSGRFNLLKPIAPSWNCSLIFTYHASRFTGVKGSNICAEPMADSSTPPPPDPVREAADFAAHASPASPAPSATVHTPPAAIALPLPPLPADTPAHPETP